MQYLDAIFGTTHDVTPLQECARAVLVFIYGLILVRIVGRRAFAKWSALDVVVSIIVGSSLSRALTGSAPLYGTLAATAVLMVLHWVLAQASARSGFCSRLFEGAAVRLAEAGRADQKKLAKNAVSGADLQEALRQAGVDDIAKTRQLTLEPSGRITVLKA